MRELIIKLNRIKQKKDFMKKLINLILYIPKFQNITNSLLFSYFNRIYDHNGNNA